MGKIRLSNGKYALFDDADMELVKLHKWYCDHGYVRAHINGKNVYMHRYLIKADGYQIDHINCNGLDNRRSNLRICSDGQNKMNMDKYKNNKSGYKGVTWHSKLWRATIVKDRKQYSLGYYKDIKDAAKAYNNKAIELFGEFAKLNEV